MNPIMLATDGSPSAAEATRQAVELARETRTKLFVVAVWQTGLTAYSSSSDPLPEKKRAAKEHAFEATRAARQLAAAEEIDAESFVLEGDPVERICESAADTNASLLVVGSHGWGALRRIVFGSVSTGLLHRAPCPVLVVRLAEDTPTSWEKAGATAGVSGGDIR
jgi:nucleotide-binding universal stress UspA family protein